MIYTTGNMHIAKDLAKSTLKKRNFAVQEVRLENDN